MKERKLGPSAGDTPVPLNILAAPQPARLRYSIRTELPIRVMEYPVRGER